MNKKLLSLFLLSSMVLTGCGEGVEPTPSSDRIPEDTDTHIIDDKYRNYYEIFVGAFANADQSDRKGIGDLKGVIQKLDYIKDTGYNGIWLMPIFKSPSYHKYNASDYYTIDPTYGSMDDLRTLIREGHNRGIDIILDLVLNHCSRENPLFQKWIAALRKQLNNQTMTAEEVKEATLFKYSLNTNPGGYSYVETQNNKKIYVEANFDGDMPEFDFDSSYARDKLKEIAKFYLDMGIDGFRLDAVRYLYYNNVTKSCEALSDFYNYCKSVKSDVYMVGEDWAGTAEITKFYNNGGCDSFFFFDAAGPTGFIKNSTNEFSANTYGYFDGLFSLYNVAKGADGSIKVPAPMMDNHDMSRIALTKDSHETTKIHNGLFAMLNGSTFTYYGDEVGENGTMGNGVGDYIVRRQFPWAPNDPLNCVNPWDCQDYSHENGFLSQQMEDANSIYNYTKKSNLLRNQIPEIARGEPLENKSEILEDENVIKLVKRGTDREILIVMNFSYNDSYTFDYSSTSYNQVIGQLCAKDDTYIAKRGDKKIEIPGFGIAILA